MNFLAHDAVLPASASPLSRVATILPDLWPRLSTPPLPLVLVRSLRADGLSAARAVAAGARAHLTADAAFHRHDWFSERVARISSVMPRAWPGVPHAELAAHILVELLIDAWLLREDRASIARYLASFTPATLSRAAELGASTPDARRDLARLLAQVASASFLSDYATPEGLVGRLVGALRRTPFFDGPPAAEPLVALVLDLGRIVQVGVASLLEELRQAVREGLERSGEWSALADEG